MFTSLVVTLALVGPSSAFAPDDTVYQGVEPQRIHQVNPAVQARLLHSDGWQRFVALDGDGWLATFDEQTGAPRRMWGRGIPMPTRSKEALVEELAALFDRHSALLGYEASTLRLANAAFSKATNTWYVDFEMPMGGMVAYRSGISARVKHGNLVSVAVSTYPTTERTGSLVFSSDDAIFEAIGQGPAPESVHTGRVAEPRWLPQQGPDGRLELRATWMVRTRTLSPPGRWVSFIDGETGELLSVHNEVRFADGVVYAEHHERTVDGSDPVVSPVPRAEVFGGEDAYGYVSSAFTGEDGTYSVEDADEYITDLAGGSWVSVVNDDGSNGVLASDEPVMTWTEDHATPAEINSYVFLHQVRAWGERVAPNNEMTRGPFTSTVNLPQTCNAYWDGNVNFYRAGDGCNNTGEIADVNYHEWGHGFHYFQIRGGYSGFDGSLSEGAADTVAFLMTDDSEIAPFFGEQGWPIRDVAPNQRYPEDFNGFDVHSNGLIFGGAMWDLWHLLRDLEGEEQGTRSTERIFAGLLEGGPDVPASYDEAMVADDDDGDLSNGTPHGCQIIEAFGDHGLGPLGSGSLYLTFHEPLVDVEPGVELPVSVEITDIAPECYSSTPTGGTLFYRVNGKKKWEEVALSVNDKTLDGAIPAQEMGTFVEYYITIDDQSGAALAAPTGSFVTPYSFYVGGVLELYCEKFEKDDGGYRHKLLAGEDRDGADDWQWGAPQGKAGDPPVAHSGDNVWGNDLGLDNFNGAYQDDKHNQLRSPKIDVPAHYTGLFLHYWRWLSIEDGAFDQAVVKVNKTTVWTNHASDAENAGQEHHLDDQWMPQAIDLAEVEVDGQVQITWDLVSDPGENYGGWNIDDVCLFVPATADNRLGVIDFEAQRNTDGTVDFAWTNPIHKPVEDVVVIRNDLAKPEGPDDGFVVFVAHDIEPGARIEGVDQLATDRASWYAVYPGDGTERLSWTEPGLNAAFVQGLNANNPNAEPIDSSGGGCQTASAPMGLTGWLAGLGLLLAARRRR